MVMVYCRKCGYKYSDTKAKCPVCGHVSEETLTKQVNQLSNGKSIAVYLILCWFLGAFGIHRFYANKIGSAVVMLILGLTFIGLFVTCIWAFIDFIIGLINISTPDRIFSK